MLVRRVAALVLEVVRQSAVRRAASSASAVVGAAGSSMMSRTRLLNSVSVAYHSRADSIPNWLGVGSTNW